MHCFTSASKQRKNLLYGKSPLCYDRRMQTFICFLFLLPASLFCSVHLKEKVARAAPGTFVVVEQGKMCTLLHIYANQQNAVLVEEISVPTYLKQNDQDWKAWAESGAPGHTSWILFELDLLENEVSECYSFTQKSHLPTEEISFFVKHLFALNLTPLTENKQLQRGATAKAGEVGLSKPWSPPMIRNGKRVKGAEYEVYETTWPRESGSVMAGKKIILYFDKQTQSFPFPHWIQTGNRGLKQKIRAIDSGIGLSSPKEGLPRRPPSFLGAPKWEKGSVYFTLEAPSYLSSFTLYAIDLSEVPRSSFLFPTAVERQGRQVQLRIEQKEVEKVLTKGHEYIWGVVSNEHQLYAEMEYPMIF